ncbi:MAG: hypothetical protein EBY42_06865 [Actinobacteria bacterium]|nr:hypothetical protein [Actinomycetota bacterium]
MNPRSHTPPGDRRSEAPELAPRVDLARLRVQVRVRVQVRAGNADPLTRGRSLPRIRVPRVVDFARTSPAAQRHDHAVAVGLVVLTVAQAMADAVAHRTVVVHQGPAVARHGRVVHR